MAYETGVNNKGFYSIMDKVIRTGSKIAITISEKIWIFKVTIPHPNTDNPSNFHAKN